MLRLVYTYAAKTLTPPPLHVPLNGVLNIAGLSLGIEYISIVMFTGLL